MGLFHHLFILKRRNEGPDKKKREESVIVLN